MKKDRVLFFLLLFVTVSLSRPVIVFKEAIGDTAKLHNMVDVIINTYSADSSLSRLKNSRYFQKVEFVDDSLFLTPAYVVRDIIIRKSYPLFEKEITNAISISSGSSLSDSVIEYQKELIINKLKSSGYVTPSVTYKKKVYREKGYIDLTFTIGKSPKYRVKDFNFEGNRRYSDFQLWFISRQWTYRFGFMPGTRWVNSNFQTTIRDLRKYYRKKQFADIKLDYKLDTIGHNINVTIKVDEGERYKVRIKTKGRAIKKMVKGYLPLEKKGNINNSLIIRAERKIDKDLDRRGYGNSKITFSDTVIIKSRRRHEKKVTVAIDKGSQISVKSLIISGNNSVTTDEIKDLLITTAGKSKESGTGALYLHGLKQDIKMIENFYYTKGFYNSEIKSEIEYLEDHKSCEILITINEGVARKITSLTINGVDSIVLNKIIEKKDLKVGDNFSPNSDKIYLETLNNRLKELGYMYAKADVISTVKSDSLSVEIVYNFQLNKIVHSGDIYFTGNFKSRDRKLKKIFKVKTGDNFSNYAIYNGVSNLRKSNLFNSVSHTVLSNDSIDTSHLFIRLNEKKPYLLNGVLGYETEKLWYGEVVLTNRNLAGYNKQLSFKLYISKYEGEINLGFIEPHIFETDLIGSINLYNTYEAPKNLSYSSSILGNSYGISYSINRSLIISSIASYETRFTIYSTTPGITSIITSLNDVKKRDNVKKRDIISTEANVTLDLRNSPLYPTKGFYSLMGANYSYSFKSDLDRFVSYSGDIRWYLTPLKFITLASRISGGVLVPFEGVDSIAVDQLFTLGGISTVRGVEQDLLFKGSDGKALYGHRSLYGNIELRLKVLSKLEIPLFVDGGSLGIKIHSSSLLAPRFTYGGGFRYLSPIGPISFVYGVPFASKSWKDGGDGVLNFSIGYSF